MSNEYVVKEPDTIRASKLKKFFRKYLLNNISRTAKNISIIFIATCIVNIINLFYHVIMGRLLGPSEYGVLTSIISLLFLTAALSGTFQTASAKYASIYFAEEKTGKLKLFYSMVTRRILVISAVILLIIFGLLYQLKLFLRLDSVYPLIYFGIVAVIGLLISFNRGILQGIKSFKSLGINLIVEVLMKLTAGIVLVYLGLKANGAMLGFMIATLTAYLIIFYPIRMGIFLKEDKYDENDKVELRKFYKSIILILISTALFSLLSYFDIAMVKHFFSSHETGIYSAAAQIGRIILFFPAAVSMVVFPRLSEKNARKEDTSVTLYKGLLIIALASIIFLVIYYFFPEVVLKIIYGSKYIEAAGLVFKYGIFMTFISLITLQFFYFITIGKYWYLIYLFLILTEQISLIGIYHSSLESILIILISNAFLLFLLNLVFIMYYIKKGKKGYGARKDIDFNPGI